MSSDGKTINFTLRSGINFADGEPLNSTAVYFSLNRILVNDGSSPVTHGPGQAWQIQQLLNPSLSVQLGAPHKYNASWLNQVLAQNFVQITGPLTFTLHIQNPNAAFAYIMTNAQASIIAPDYVMQHDLAMWNQSSTGYNLPYPTLTGANYTAKINQYFLDEVATCDSGATPKGCGTTYLDSSASGSLAGTGPYTISSASQTTNNIILKANPSFWGAPYQFSGGQKITPHFQTININYVPTLTTRELDLQSAAKSGQAMTVDIPGDNLFDVAQRGAWLNNDTLVSSVPGVTLYGPFTTFQTGIDHFPTNVSDPLTGKLLAFQPFADRRLRLAFADSVNMTEINVDINNRLGQVAVNAIPPGLPPQGSFNASIVPVYSFNLTAVQNLLVDAMLHPLTQFTYVNGTAAQPGVFNNTFGCSTLNSKGQCSNPVGQSIQMIYQTGDTVNEAIDNQIASAINNVSTTYNMGLTVSVVPLPLGQLLTRLFSRSMYFYSLPWGADYPWVNDMLGNIYAPQGAYPSLDNWNLTQMTVLYAKAVAGTANNNDSEVVAASNAMNQLGNEGVMYLWTFYPTTAWTNSAVAAITSNVHGYFYNPSTEGPYFATFY